MDFRGLALLLAVAIGFAGCQGEEYRELGDADDVTNTDPVDEHHHHHDEGPHGGHILEFGEYHGEITYSDGTVSVYVLGDDAETSVPLENAIVTLMLGEGDAATKVELKADPQEGEEGEQSSRYSASEGLPEGIDDIEKIEGSVELKVGEKSMTANIEHHHH